MYVVANHTVYERQIDVSQKSEQLSLFVCDESADAPCREQRERKIQETILSLRKRFGKNAVLKGMNFKEGATTIERNQQIGGHRA